MTDMQTQTTAKTKKDKQMTNQIAKKTENIPAVNGTEAENILNAAREDGFEAFLKFDKGKFYLGNEEVPLGTEYIAYAKAWVKCWIKFVDGKVAERKVYRVSLGDRPPERNDLDDNDKSTWPLVARFNQFERI
jgi:hypothetical protein